MNSKPTVIVYRDELLGVSETFIRAQAEALTAFSPYYVGLRPRPGLGLPGDRTLIMTDLSPLGRLQRASFKFFGPNGSLLRHLRNLRPQLIHAHFGPDACNALELAEALNIPMVVSLHGYDITRNDAYHSKFYLRRRQRLQQKTARFLCVSDFIRHHSLIKGFPDSKTVVHYTGVDTKFFQPKADVSRLPVALFVGRLVPEKGCTHFIQAMQKVQRRVAGAKVVIIGDGPLRPELEREAAARLTHYEFLGAKSAEIVRDWMNWASVFCAPSGVEGFGMVLAEAQAMGLPIVGFETGGIPEAVANGETGLLVPNGDVQQLTEKIVDVLQDPIMQARFGRAGRIRVARHFNIQRQSEALEGIYNQVLNERNRFKGRDASGTQAELFPQIDGIVPHVRETHPRVTRAS